MYSSHYSCLILMKLKSARQSFEKYSNIKFHAYLSSGIPAVPWERTDRQDKANSQSPPFYESPTPITAPSNLRVVQPPDNRLIYMCV
jgi:hypothetical protein